MLSCWPLLCAKIFNELEDIKLTSHGLEVHSKVKKLCDSVCSLNFVSDSIDVHVFGSRLYGLATGNSDVDVYLEIGEIHIPSDQMLIIFHYRLSLNTV